MVKKYYLIILVFLFLISFISSIDCWGTFKQNSEVQLLQKCPSCSFVNLTSITYPNQTLFTNEEMQKIGVNFNYTLPDSSQTGIISYGTIGDKDGVLREQTLCVELTRTGQTIDTPESSFYFLILFVVLGLFLFFFVIGMKMPYKNDVELTEDGWAVTKITKSKYFKIIFLWISYGFFLWFLTIISGITNNYIFFPELKKTMSNLLFFFSSLGWGINIAVISVLFWMLWKDIIMNKAILNEGRAILNKEW